MGERLLAMFKRQARQALEEEKTMGISKLTESAKNSYKEVVVPRDGSAATALDSILHRNDSTSDANFRTVSGVTTGSANLDDDYSDNSSHAIKCVVARQTHYALIVNDMYFELTHPGSGDTRIFAANERPRLAPILSDKEMSSKIAAARHDAEDLKNKIKRRKDAIAFATLHPKESRFLDMFRSLKASVKVDSSNVGRPKVAGRKALPMIINDRTIFSRHDTGAEENFMDETLRTELGLKLLQGKQDRAAFSMGNGRLVQAAGRVKALCTFATEPGANMECSFYVLKQLASPLIMGFPFLRKTETLSKYVNRLQEIDQQLPLVPSLKLISSASSVKRRLHCSVDGRQEYVNTDSGADLDFVSEKYARFHRYHIDARVKRNIEMGDRSIAQTIGQISAAIILDDDTRWNRTFNVLPGLTSDVVLSDESLEMMEIWTRHEASFIDVPTDQVRHLELNILVYLGEVAHSIARLFRGQRNKQDTNFPMSSSSEARDMEDFNELHRRDTETARINIIQDLTRRHAEQEKEQRRVHRYERERRGRLTASHQHVISSSATQNQN